jgi:hypothetical protein
MKIAKITAGTPATIRPRRSALTRSAPEAPLARRELLQRRLERRAVEVGPQLVAEDELGVRRLPEQVVRQALLAAGADHEVGVVHLGRVEQRAERLLPAALVALGGVEDLRRPP